MMSLKNLMPAWVKRIGVTTALLLFVGGIVFWCMEEKHMGLAAGKRRIREFWRAL
jgi:hypothetical protein